MTDIVIDKEKSQFYILMGFGTISFSVTEIGVRCTEAVKRTKSSKPDVQLPGVDNITVVQDGTGKHQHSTGVKGEVRKTLNGLKWHIEESNATSSHVLQRTTHHDEEVLLFRLAIH